MRNVYEQTIVEALPPLDHASAAVDGNYISMKGYDHCTIVIQTGAWAGGTAAVTVNRATAVDATGEDQMGKILCDTRDSLLRNERFE